MIARFIAFGLVALFALLAASVDPWTVTEIALVPIVGGLVVAELDREGGWLAVRLVSLATLLLPEDSRQDHEDEWIDHVLAAGEHGLRPMAAALGIACLAAPRLAVAERRSAFVAGDPLGRLLDALRRLRALDALAPIEQFDRITEIQLLRMSDTEIVELQHAMRAVRRRGGRVPRALVFAMASDGMSHRAHRMRDRRVRRRRIPIRLLAHLRRHFVRSRLLDSQREAVSPRSRR